MKLIWYKITKNVELSQGYDKEILAGRQFEAHCLNFKDFESSNETSNDKMIKGWSTLLLSS